MLASLLLLCGLAFADAKITLQLERPPQRLKVAKAQSKPSSRQQYNELLDRSVRSYAAIDVGNATRWLLADTGSANTIIGLATPYRSGTDMKAKASLYYGDGSYGMTVEQYSDVVSIGRLQFTYSALASWKQNINGGLGLDDGIDGILGLAPSYEMLYTWIRTAQGHQQYVNHGMRTLIEAAYQQGLIARNMFSMYSPPPLSFDSSNPGQLTIGAENPANWCAPLNYHAKPIGNLSADSLQVFYPFYWSLDVSYKYNGVTLDINDLGSPPTSSPTAPSFMDHGTPSLVLPESVWQAYTAASGVTCTQGGAVCYVPKASMSSLADFEVIIDGKSYPLPPAAQVWPYELSSQMLDPSVGLVTIFDSTGSKNEYGVLGLGFLSRYYTSYTTSGKSLGARGRIGIAPTRWTFAQTADAPASKLSSRFPDACQRTPNGFKSFKSLRRTAPVQASRAPPKSAGAKISSAFFKPGLARNAKPPGH